MLRRHIIHVCDIFIELHTPIACSHRFYHMKSRKKRRTRGIRERERERERENPGC
jgi:hypothetical protein